MLNSDHFAIIRSVAAKYIGRSDDWYWEDLLVDLARRDPFNVQDDLAGNLRIPLQGLYAGRSVAGTGSAGWNSFIGEFGAQLRQEQGDFRKAKYDDPSAIRRLVESIAKAFELHAGAL